MVADTVAIVGMYRYPFRQAPFLSPSTIQRIVNRDASLLFGYGNVYDGEEQEIVVPWERVGMVSGRVDGIRRRPTNVSDGSHISTWDGCSMFQQEK